MKNTFKIPKTKNCGVYMIFNFNNKKIESLLKPGTFVLNREVQALIESNDMLRAECPHIFEKGICIYCGRKEDEK